MLGSNLKVFWHGIQCQQQRKNRVFGKTRTRKQRKADRREEAIMASERTWLANGRATA
jgi:hypothetical protein